MVEEQKMFKLCLLSLMGKKASYRLQVLKGLEDLHKTLDWIFFFFLSKNHFRCSIGVKY